MEAVTEEYDVGVLVGRFQVSDLHEGHKSLIDSVMARHQKTILILGMSALPISTSNPLDFESRRQMIQAVYPNLNILYVRDVPNDGIWSKNIDRIIRDLIGANQTAAIYGSRDSFIPHYHGTYPTVELVSEMEISGTEHRREIGKAARNDPAWRAGVIWATQQFFPTSYVAVDIAIFTQDGGKLLLGRKPNESALRLPGGFSDPQMPGGLKQDAERELHEETGLRVPALSYVDSFPIDDWRYSGEPHAVKTVLYVGYLPAGQIAEAADDLAEVHWVDKGSLPPLGGGNLMPVHRPLIDAAVRFDNNRRFIR